MSEGEGDALSGDDLTPYRDVNRGLCWWCGAAADSREHKFKRTDLDRAKVGEPLLWGSTESDELRTIRSHRRSSLARFAANLCAACNNRRSQPFDLAYDRYAEYVWQNHQTLLRRDTLDMQEVFGSNWSIATANLARYFVKHIGCRMASDGFQPPAEFQAFLEGSTDLLSTLAMVTFRDLTHLRWWHRRPAAGEDWFALSIGPARGRLSKSNQRLIEYGSTVTTGRIGVFYWWNFECTESDPFYTYRRARLHRRSTLPEL